MRGNGASLVFYPLLQFEKQTTARKNNQIFEHIKERDIAFEVLYSMFPCSQYAMEQMVKPGEIMEVELPKYKKGSFDK